MIQKKICMVGSFSVGKTSMVRRYIHSLFSEKYLTTVGVRIEKKEILAEETQVILVIWDIAGDDPFQSLPMSYLRGAAGYMLVADCVNEEGIDKVILLKQRIRKQYGEIPMVLALNKIDLVEDGQKPARATGKLQKTIEIPVIECSAKIDQNVDLAFDNLAKLLI